MRAVCLCLEQCVIFIFKTRRRRREGQGAIRDSLRSIDASFGCKSYTYKPHNSNWIHPLCILLVGVRTTHTTHSNDQHTKAIALRQKHIACLVHYVAKTFFHLSPFLRKRGRPTLVFWIVIIVIIINMNNSHWNHNDLNNNNNNNKHTF